MHLDISIGEHAVDYAQIAAKEKLNELQLRVRQLLDQVEQIQKEQAYQRVTQHLPLNHITCHQVLYFFQHHGPWEHYLMIHALLCRFERSVSGK